MISSWPHCCERELIGLKRSLTKVAATERQFEEAEKLLAEFLSLHGSVECQVHAYRIFLYNKFYRCLASGNFVDEASRTLEMLEQIGHPTPVHWLDMRFELAATLDAHHRPNEAQAIRKESLERSRLVSDQIISTISARSKGD